jgi:hypothetical protein
MFMLHFQGEVTFDRYARLLLYSDDGGMLRLNGAEVYASWYDQGCSPFYVEINPGVYDIDVWMYENGGGSCVHLMQLSEDTTSWSIVDSFTTNGIPTVTSTTIQETTTSWDTTTSSTTTTTTTSTIAPSTTVPVIPNWTTSTPQIISTPPPEPTMPEPPAVVPLPQIEIPATLETMLLPPEIETYPPETLNLPPEIVDTMPYPVDTYPTVYPSYTLPFVGELPDPPDTMPLPPDTLPDAPEPPVTLPIAVIAELPPELVEALLDAGNTDIPLTEEQFNTVVDTIENLAPEEAVALITQILATAVTADQATALAANPDVLAVITSDQAEEIFATIEVAALDETQIAELTTAIQNAPLAVQKAFEKTIDIFGGFDDYVPTGSNIPVGERRTLIAIAAGTTLTAASSKIKKK